MRNLTYFAVLFTITIQSQSNLQEGFQLLENGNFQEAETFFDSYLKTDATNKTAQICYGRAVGLNAKPKEANTLFADLLEVYPDDFEVQINYNESFLWDKRFKDAKPLYASLVENYPDNFGALLGYANTLSNLKEFVAALNWVEKALVIQPENESAKISKKYMKLGYANELVNKQNYISAEKLLKEIIVDFSGDKDALQNLANLYLITKQVSNAKETYYRLVTSAKDSITAFNGIALANHIDEKEKEALRIVQLAKSRVGAFDDSTLTERTYDRYVQALIWNRKFIKARRQLDSLEKAYPKRNWIYALKATLGLYTGDAKSSVANYNRILENDSLSFDGNLGQANALFAADRIIPAYEAAFKTLEIFKNQKDATSFIEKLNVQYTPYVEEHVAYTFDNGNNTAFSTNTTVSTPVSTKFSTTVSYQYRRTENTRSLNKANSHVLLAGLAYKLYPKVKLKGVFGINNSNFMTEAYTQPILDLKLELQPFKLQNLAIGYQREVQNFNADLIEREIVLNNYGLSYNLGTNVNLGWYTQIIHTQQSDSNSRNLLFTSLYYTLLRKPELKVGVNYQYITFKNQVPAIYFSPEHYQATEFFLDLRGNFSKKTNYMMSAAIGLQRVEQDSKTDIFRAEAGVQHQFSKRFSVKGYGKYSNIASATAAGFEFAELGFKLKWLFAKKPLFYQKLVR